jgi:L-lactate dehydrogenase (cytochrome)
MNRATIIRPVSARDYRHLASRRLPRFLFDYIEGGAVDERTLSANEADFKDIHLRQRVLRDVSNVDTSTTLGNAKVSMPLVLAPVGLAGMMAKRGEVLGMRGAAAAGVPFCLSTVGVCSIEEVASSSDGHFWFQLYMLKDRDLVVSLLERAAAVGCETLVFTVDLPVPGQRHRDLRKGMLGSGLRYSMNRAWNLAKSPNWLFNVGLMGGPHCLGNLSEVVPDAKDLNAYKLFVASQFDSTVTWDDIQWLRGQWKGKIIIKGIMAADDARAAADAGADAVIVSNHGGRQLDGVSSTIRKLPEVAAAVGSQIPVYMDGGVRSGVDLVKAVALGAQAVLIGRPWVWAVAGAGEQGLIDLLSVLQREVAVSMALMGVTRVSDLNPELLEAKAKSA